MAYKIAVASSDEKNVNLHFGEAKEFLIFVVADDGTFSLAEKRIYSEEVEPAGENFNCNERMSCGCSGNSGAGCGAGSSKKVELIADVRAVVALKIGFNIQRQLEKKAVSSFDVNCGIQEALEKITKYFFSMDNHKPFRK